MEDDEEDASSNDPADKKNDWNEVVMVMNAVCNVKRMEPPKHVKYPSEDSMYEFETMTEESAAMCPFGWPAPLCFALWLKSSIYFG